MTNLEFYKEEIKERIYNSRHTDDALYYVINKFYNDAHHQYEVLYENANESDLLDWLCEEHQILDKEEKEYLSAVIKPFRCKIRSISKEETMYGYEYLKIKLNDAVGLLNFPLFEEGAMYKGMKVNKEYTLEELGL